MSIDADYTAVISSLKDAISDNAEVWIGIEDTSDDNTANSWSFSSSEVTVTNFNWQNNWPKDDRGRCVYKKAKNEKWFNGECDDATVRNFICEF